MAEVPCDFKELLECFNAHGVEFVVVGAHALAVHGRPRATGDLDLLMRPDLENAKRVLAALNDFGFPSMGFGPEGIAVPDQVVQLGVPPVRIDILTSISGVSWEEAWASRVSGKIGGVPVQVIGRDAYIANKRAAGRPKDLVDADEVEKLSEPGR